LIAGRDIDLRRGRPDSDSSSGGDMSLRSILVALLAGLAAGCTSLDFIPQDNALVTGPGPRVLVTIQLVWPSGTLAMGPDVWVDGAKVPLSVFTLTSSGAVALVQMAPGSHSVRVHTAQLCAACIGGVAEFDKTHSFYVSAT
jgi:hypothetical protein